MSLKFIKKTPNFIKLYQRVKNKKLVQGGFEQFTMKESLPQTQIF